MQDLKFGSGGLHLRMKAFAHMFVCFGVAFCDPVTALALSVVCTAFMAKV